MPELNPTKRQLTCTVGARGPTSPRAHLIGPEFHGLREGSALKLHIQGCALVMHTPPQIFECTPLLAWLNGRLVLL